LRVKPSNSPSSKTAAASVALLREPGRRPAGLPERPFSKGRPRPRPGGFGETPSCILMSFVRPAAPLRRENSNISNFEHCVNRN
jgi:hypothetical protein